MRRSRPFTPTSPQDLVSERNPLQFVMHDPVTFLAQNFRRGTPRQNRRRGVAYYTPRVISLVRGLP